MNFRPMQNVVYHIAKYYRSKNSALVDKNKSDEKGKAKVEEIRDKH